MCDNKRIGGVVKPLLSNKFVYNVRITLLEDGKIVESDKNAACVLNKFFANIMTTLGIPQYNERKPVSQNLGDPLIKTIMKYTFHPIIIAIKKKCNSSLSYSSSQVERDEIIKKLITLRQIKPHKTLYLVIIIIVFPILFFQSL